jgi:hypothetical protein
MELVKSSSIETITKEIAIGYDKFNFAINAKNEFSVSKNDFLLSTGYIKDPEGTRQDLMTFLIKETLTGATVKIRKDEYFRGLAPYGLYLKALSGQKTYVIERL